MAQSFEYPMWSPNEKARLFKRFTGELSAELKNNEIIKYESNRYVYRSRFLWVETTSKTEGEYQPIDGLLMPNGYVTIKTNSLKKFETGDLVVLDNQLWIIDGDTEIDYVYTPKKVQTYQYLQLKKVK